MKDIAFLALAVSPFVALPLAVFALAVGGLLGATVGGFLLSYAVVGIVLPGNRRLVRDIWMHGIHNDR